jgi:Rhodopirellula transposase DDE domain
MEIAHRAIMLKVLNALNEAQARWYVAKEALALGRGGLKAMHELTGMSRPTILKGIRDLRQKRLLGESGRLRRPGGGRKALEASDPPLQKALEKIMEETTAGDPMSPLRWTSKSTYRIAEELTQQGHVVSQRSVHRKLSDSGYSLQGNAKSKEGSAPANRDAQFRAINARIRNFIHQGNPVLSIDTKKKERVGNFKNAGRTWRPQGEPREVNTYDFPSLAVGTAIPYGAYDVRRNQGFVNVGMTHDTAECAVESLRQWWMGVGRRYYPQATEWLLCADSGGSNSNRSRAWKYYLQQLSDQLDIGMGVCHYPPGTSKWNKVEHRLFSFISLNWKGEPLVSYETVVNLIGSTRTKKGLRVKAKLDKKQYETGKKISDDEMDQLNIKYDKVNPQWNYTIYPRTKKKKDQK